MQNTELLLLVDDSLDNLKVLSSLLKKEYRVKVATGGHEALRLAREKPVPDLILLDIIMPEMDGYTVCARLKSDPQTREIPIIFLTAKTQTEDETQGFQMGAVDYITKPINPPVLWARVRAQLALATQLRHSHQELDKAGHRLIRVTSERDRIEIQRQRLYDQQQALLAIARAALLDLSLEKYLEITLEVFDTLPWLKIEARGMLFLRNRKGDLIMVAQRGLSETQSKKAPALLMECLEHGPQTADDTMGCYVLPLIEERRVHGVLAIFLLPGTRLDEEASKFMTDVTNIFTNLIRRRQMEETMRVSRLEVQMAHHEIIQKLSIAAESRDTETGLHVLRVSQYARVIAQTIGLDEATCELMTLAASMHDVGKIGIEDQILRKRDKLTDEEFAVMKQHTTIGSRILEGDDPLIRMGREIALTHHEKWDGSGYPNGLSGENIPFSGRICAVADVFDALTIQRPYKKAWPVEKAVALIVNEIGRAFDPQVVAAFQQALPEILTIKARYQDDINPGELIARPSTHVNEDAWIPWHDSYSVGVDVIDEHHRYLLDWVNHAYKAINEGMGTIEIAKTLFALEQYTQIHFKAEERLMAVYGYAELEQHRQQHRSFEVKLQELREEIRYNPFIVGREMMEYLRDWLFNHILKSDKQSLRCYAVPNAGQHGQTTPTLLR